MALWMLGQSRDSVLVETTPMLGIDAVLQHLIADMSFLHLSLLLLTTINNKGCSHHDSSCSCGIFKL